MATLSGTAKIANHKRSLDVYIVQHALLSSFAFDIGPPIAFKDRDLSEWIQPRMLEPVVTMQNMQISTTRRGDDWEIRFNVNIFIRPASQSIGHRLHQIRDLVLAAFAEATRIELRDYEGGGALLGHLVVVRIEADRRVIDPLRTDLEQWNMLIVMRPPVADWFP